MTERALPPVSVVVPAYNESRGIAATDADIANFFNFPLHKLNMGKQSYESNEQQELNYIRTLAATVFLRNVGADSIRHNLFNGRLPFRIEAQLLLEAF